LAKSKKTKRRRSTRASRRRTAERVEKNALICAVLLAYYATLGNITNQLAAAACALGALVFASVSVGMFAYFALGRRGINALCWLLTFCATSLVFVKLT
jgi:hypothetical protein